MSKFAVLFAIAVGVVEAPALTQTVGGITYTYSVSNGAATLGSERDWVAAIPASTRGAIVLPSTLGGYPVKAIGEGAFDGCESLTSVTIPEGVVKIGDEAFCCCSSLKSITLPNSLTDLGVLTFESCRSLTSVTIPAGVKELGMGLFFYCDSLAAVTLPDGLKTIAESAFEGCDSLTSVTIPQSVTEIGDGAFSYCGSLSSVTIPGRVTRIGNWMFGGCAALSSVTLPGSVKTIGGESFVDCNSLRSLVLPEGVTTIESCAFWNCNSLVSLTIPTTLTKIGDKAFFNCSSLDSIGVAEGDAERVRNLLMANGINADQLTFVEPITGIRFEGELYRIENSPQDCEDPHGDEKYFKHHYSNDDFAGYWQKYYVEVDGRKEPAAFRDNRRFGFAIPILAAPDKTVTPEIVHLTSNESCFYPPEVLSDAEMASWNRQHCDAVPRSNPNRRWIILLNKEIAKVKLDDTDQYRFDLTRKQAANGRDMLEWAMEHGESFPETIALPVSVAYKLRIKETGEEFPQRFWNVHNPMYDKFPMFEGDDYEGENYVECPGLWLVTEAMLDQQAVVLKLLPGAGSGASVTLRLEPDIVYNVPANPFTAPSGKRFAGWSGSNGRRYDDKVLVVNPVAIGKKLTLTAIWE